MSWKQTLQTAVRQLKQEKSTLETQLREVDQKIAAIETAQTPAQAKTSTKRNLSDAGRRAISRAAKKRWAEYRRQQRS